MRNEIVLYGHIFYNMDTCFQYENIEMLEEEFNLSSV